MDSIANLKEQSDALTPLLLFEAELAGGQIERWSTHSVTVGGEFYEARVVRHNFFAVQAASESGVDAIPRIAVTLGNADSRFSQLDTSVGFRGAKLRARFVFYDLEADVAVTPESTVFQGILNPPDEIAESTVRLSAINRMSMQRVLLPTVRIQRRCPWTFPETAEQRAEAVNGGAEGSYSRFFSCGYSAGEPGGVGNLDSGGQPFTTCSFTRADCTARGMFSADGTSALSRRFGGIEFVPATILVRGHGEKGYRSSEVSENEARYNDFVPLQYGTVWVDAPIVFGRNDGNLTRMEVLIGLGRIDSVLKVLVNDIEIPTGVSGRDMTPSGWWNLFADGGRAGGFNVNFTTSSGTPLGDPYGSMACLSVVVPNQINDGRSLPRVKVLMRGLRLERFDAVGGSLGFSYSNNPAWVLLDILRRSGWKLSEIDVTTFATAAAFCDQTIAATDNQGNPISKERFRCNLVIRSRRTAADVIRGVRNGARLQLTYRQDGSLAVYVENSVLLQQPTKPEGSNAPAALNGGWPAYVYTDGSDPAVPSAILRQADDSPALRLFSKPIADSPNRFSIEFADEFNEYQQDSLELVDTDDIARTGQEITGRLVADGLPTYDQSARIMKFFLDRSIKGNRFIEFETSVKGVGQHVGDLIAVTYVKEGLFNQIFRILKIQPGPNYRTVRITAQVHDDAWYNDTNGQLTLVPPTRPQSKASTGTPVSLYGYEYDEYGDQVFAIEEFVSSGSDGAILTEIEVGFNAPEAGRSVVASVPIVDLQPTVLATGGTLVGGETFYYTLTAIDADGLESNPSFVVRAVTAAGGATHSVQLTGLGFSVDTVAFNVYRGDLPTRLHRIAAAQAVATSFADDGLAEDVAGAPDPRYDHANFYWRIEDTEEDFASVFGPDSIGSSSLALTIDGLIGHSVRIIRGKGAGQERAVTNNTATDVSVVPKWELEPDPSSVFVVSENTWHFGGRARSSPARFAIPNLGGRVVQVTGRAANAQNIESLEGLAIVTRWRIGGGELGVVDRNPPPVPGFSTNVLGDGNVLFSGLGFTVLEDTQTISAGRFTVHYRDELNGPGQLLLSAGVDEFTMVLPLGQVGFALPGDLVQVDREIVRVDDIHPDGLAYMVTRGACRSFAVSHAAGEPVYRLARRTETAAFPRGIFGTPAAAEWSHVAWMPGLRIACVEAIVTNSLGDSPVGTENYSELIDRGLRTLHGGQFNLQYEGPLAILSDAAAHVTVQENLAIHDCFAHLKQAPTGADVVIEILQNTTAIATLTILTGQTTSGVLNGSELPILQESAQLWLNITSVGTDFPASDLSLTIRV
jgi:hypothetical protein